MFAINVYARARIGGEAGDAIFGLDLRISTMPCGQIVTYFESVQGIVGSQNPIRMQGVGVLQRLGLRVGEVEYGAGYIVALS